MQDPVRFPFLSKSSASFAASTRLLGSSVNRLLWARVVKCWQSVKSISHLPEPDCLSKWLRADLFRAEGIIRHEPFIFTPRFVQLPSICFFYIVTPSTWFPAKPSSFFPPLAQNVNQSRLQRRYAAWEGLLQPQQPQSAIYRHWHRPRSQSLWLGSTWGAWQCSQKDQDCR